MPLPNLLATRHGRLIAFFLLYVTEGIPLGFTATAVATLYLPWAWKWVMGPVVDLLYASPRDRAIQRPPDTGRGAAIADALRTSLREAIGTSRETGQARDRFRPL